MIKEVHINDYVTGMPQTQHFKTVNKVLPELKEGEILIKNNWMSVDPYMRGRMVNRKSYIPPFKLNEALEGSAVGTVQASKHKDFLPGDVVISMKGWREEFIAADRELVKLPNTSSPEHYLGLLGMPGLTAYSGLLKIGQPKQGETVFVSAASGAVGSLVCQIAKIKGCKVITSAGSDEKVRWLKEEINVDAAFNYKMYDDLNIALKEVAPHGIDIYFDNVGGDHLEAAINQMNIHGRIIVCGMISQYNLDKPAHGPANLIQIISKRLLVQGFIVSDYDKIKPEFYKDMQQWINSGDIKYKTHIYYGIENASKAFIDLFTGENIGKMLVKL